MSRLLIVVGVLSLFIIVLVANIAFVQLQFRNINRQLSKRLVEHTRQPISLELINKELNILVANINKCLKAEEILRLESIREEKRFKEMIANISHDLRTPLTAIKGYQQLMEKGDLTEDQKLKLQIAQKHTHELGGLIEHFFEYSYLVNSELKANIERINLTDLLIECLAEAVTTFEERGLRVHFEESPAVFIVADKEMTIRILQNLIRNCATHSVGDIEVHVFSLESGVITFRNPVASGSKIEVEQLFDRFYTADQSRSKTTGLGLHIVKLLAEQMGGSTGAVIKDGMLEIWVKLPLV